MDGVERILGELREFKKSTEKRLDKMEVKIDALQGFKFKILGFCAAISFVCGAIGAVFEIMK